MYSLGIDTSNYATSLAVVDNTAGEVVCDLKRLLPVRAGERGLRQSDALFHHTQALPLMLSELFAHCDSTAIKAVGVSARPRSDDGSYMPCFLAGVSAAVAFATAKNIPLIKTSHQNGHIAAAAFACKSKELFVNRKLVFHISGGTTELLLCNGIEAEKRLAQTTDLYAGQAVDRIGVLMGFNFPAGAELSALALKCNDIIKPKVNVKNGCCSISGLENQCKALLQDGRSNEYVAKYCLSQIGFTVLEMLEFAKITYADLPVICAGGVMCSEIIRPIITERYPEARFVPAKFSSDNAIGVGVIAAREATECKRLQLQP